MANLRAYSVRGRREMEVRKTYLKIRKELFRIHGLEKLWAQRNTELLEQGMRQWTKRWEIIESEPAFVDVIREAKAQLDVHMVKRETERVIDQGKVILDQSLKVVDVERKVKAKRKRDKRVMYKTPAGDVQTRDADEYDEHPVPSGGLVDEVPDHWRVGEIASLNKSDIAWAIHHLRLPVLPADAPTPAAWSLLLIGREDPADFMTRWGAIALPKKDTDEQVSKFDDDASDVLTELDEELARIGREVVSA